MTQTSINIRTDEDLKKQFDAFCSDAGMSMSAASRVFAKTAVKERRISFEIFVEKDLSYSATNATRLREPVAEMETAGGTAHEVKLDGQNVDRRRVGRL